MNQLSNAFSLLNVDVADDENHTIIAAANNGVDSKEKKGKGKKYSDNTGGTTLSKDKNSDQTLSVSFEEYKQPLLWIDLEMTGLNIEVDRILEIACVITDGNLTKSVEVVEFVRKHLGTQTPLLAGNSVYADLLFLKKYMPTLASLVPHVLVDVSSVRALCIRWYPRDSRRAPQKQKKHRAMDDIKESIAELKFFKENIFKQKSKK